jgi:hypothetical protein
MSSFSNLLSRAYLLSEAKVSPYASSHPSFGKITTPMSNKGLSSAPLHTMQFIREILYNLDIITHDELLLLKKPFDFSGKKQALLQMLRDREAEINAKSKEIEERVSNTLDNFINEMMLRNEEKYVAQAAAKEVAKQMRQARSGKQMDDALADIVTDDSILVRSAVAQILNNIEVNLGEPGFDIEEDALREVVDYSDQINSLSTLKSYIRKIAAEPGKEKIASYLYSAVKPISQYMGAGNNQPSVEDEEMQGYSNDEAEEGEGDDGFEKLTQDYSDTSLDPEVKQAQMKVLRSLSESVVAGTEKYLNENWKQAARGMAAAGLTAAAAVGGAKIAPQVGSIGKEIASVAKDLTSKSDNNQFLDKITNPADRKMVEDELKSIDLAGQNAELSGKSSAVMHQRLKFGEIERQMRKKYSIPPEIVLTTESVTSSTALYLTEQIKKDSLYRPNKEETVTFKSRYKPKTHWQLEELRRYGL